VQRQQKEPEHDVDTKNSNLRAIAFFTISDMTTPESVRSTLVRH
jgi:hypothetical protein